MPSSVTVAFNSLSIDTFEQAHVPPAAEPTLRGQSEVISLTSSSSCGKISMKLIRRLPVMIVDGSHELQMPLVFLKGSSTKNLTIKTSVDAVINAWKSYHEEAGTVYTIVFGSITDQGTGERKTVYISELLLYRIGHLFRTENSLSLTTLEGIAYEVFFPRGIIGTGIVAFAAMEKRWHDIIDEFASDVLMFD